MIVYTGKRLKNIEIIDRKYLKEINQEPINCPAELFSSILSAITGKGAQGERKGIF